MKEEREPHKLYQILMPYVVAIVGIRPEGTNGYNVSHMGTGTLIELGGVRGLLTAAHVIEALSPFDIWGFANFNGNRGYTRLHSFPRDSCHAVKYGKNYKHTDGPDIGFIRLPDNITSQASNEATYFSITKRYEKYLNGHKREPLEIHILAGVIGEGSKEIERTEDATDIETMMLVAPCKISDYSERKDFDYFVAKITHSEHAPLPASYGGISGGPIWAINETASFDERIIVGVAFKQSDAEENGNRTILCHGPRSIYECLFDLIRMSFPKEFSWPTVSTEMVE